MEANTKSFRIIDLPNMFRFRYKNDAEYWKTNNKSWQNITKIEIITDRKPMLWRISTKDFSPVEIYPKDLYRYEFINTTNLYK